LHQKQLKNGQESQIWHQWWYKMKPSKMRNKQIYYATMQTTSSQLSGMLSKNLRKKYGKRSVRIVEGDSVKVIRGEFNGVDGKVTKVSASNGGLTIEGVKKEKLKGEKYDVFIHTSNIEVTGLNTDDKWRINKLEGKNARAVRPKVVKKDTAKELKVKQEETSESTDKITKTKQKKEMKK